MSTPLLVLDLNGVLLDRRKRKLAGGQTLLGSWGGSFAYGRPYASEFVAWAASMGWDVGLWTSAKRENADPLARAALGAAYDRLRFVYAQEECEIFRESNSKKQKALFKKPLARLWREGLGCPRRTVLLDDGKEKICEGEEDNALICPAYDARSPEADDALAPGGWARNALSEIMAADDVRDRIVAAF